MGKRIYIYVAICENVFRGYGIIASGTTAQQARDALWDEYVATSPKWNDTETPYHESFDALKDYFGVNESKLRIGKAYFGMGGEEDHNTKSLKNRVYKSQ